MQALESYPTIGAQALAARRRLLPRHASSALLWIHSQADFYAAD